MKNKKKEKKIAVGFRFKESLCKKLEALKIKVGIPKNFIVERLVEKFFKEKEGVS